MKKIILLFLMILFCCFGVPRDLFAWGIGTHLYLGNAVLDILKVLGAESWEFLYQYRDFFLYGNISADILVGKGKRLYPTHCHNWNVGFTLINCVDSPALKAYAYGYLVHLSSDVIAHNFFVPNLIQLSKGAGKVSHLLIELEVDKELSCSRDMIESLIKFPFKEPDSLLQRVLAKSKINFLFKKSIYKICNLFSFPRNKTKNNNSIIFKNGLRDYLQEMLNLSISVSVNCITELNNSPITRYDPMGFKNLNIVKRIKWRGLVNPMYKKNIYFFFSPTPVILNTTIGEVCWKK